MSTAEPRNVPTLTPKVLGGFIGSGVIALIAANFVPIFISGLSEDLGFDLGAAGMIATSLAMASVVSMWLATFFVAKHSRPMIAGSGAILMVIGFGLAAVFYSPQIVPLGLIVAGLGCGIMAAASVAAVSSTADPDKSTTVIALINRLAVSALFLLAPVWFGDLRSVFVVLAILGGLGLVLVRGLPNPPTPRLATSAPPDSAAGHTLKLSGVILAIALGLWSMTEDMVYSLTTAVFGVHAGLSPEASTSALAYKVLGGLLGTVLAPLALKKLGRSMAIVLVVIVSTASKFILITTGDPTAYIISLIVWGVVYLTALVLVLGLAAQMDLSGRTGVFVNSLYTVGIAMGPLIGGALQPRMSFHAYAVLDCTIAVLAGLTIAAVSIKHTRGHNPRLPLLGDSIRAPQ
ncbi:MFS transporter [Brevibacterium linens]|uniref:MFS transporter n=1 Tax=Brevibacterium linens TaxID=1703 RepID=UPI003BF53D26